MINVKTTVCGPIGYCSSTVYCRPIGLLYCCFPSPFSSSSSSSSSGECLFQRGSTLKLLRSNRLLLWSNRILQSYRLLLLWSNRILQSNRLYLSPLVLLFQRTFAIISACLQRRWSWCWAWPGQRGTQRRHDLKPDDGIATMYGMRGYSPKKTAARLPCHALLHTQQ